jgi:hypothetical protein
VDLRVSQAGNGLVFVLGKPSRLLSLEVCSSLGETLWTILPSALIPLPVLRMNHAYVQLPHDEAMAVLEVMKDAVATVRGTRELDTKIATSQAQPFRDLADAIAQNQKLPEETARIALKALVDLRESLQTDDRHRVTPALIAEMISSMTARHQPIPAVSRIVYGEVPGGYRETEPASKLVRGERYSITSIGEEPFEIARVYHSF